MKTNNKRAVPSPTAAVGRRRSRGHFRLTALHPLFGNLRNGFRVAFFCRVDLKAWCATVPQLVAVVALGLLLDMVLQRTFYLEARFNWGALSDQCAAVSVYLLVGWLAVRVAGAPLKLLVVPIALYAAALVASPLWTALAHAVSHFPDRIGQWGWVGIHYGWHLWLLAVAAMLLHQTARLNRGALIGVMLPLVAFHLYDTYFPPAPLWEDVPAERTAARPLSADSPVTEELLYLQPRITHDTIGAIASHRSGVADVYFVGYAPYAHEDVFMKESEVIRELMDQRFDARGRSLLLVNNDQALRKYPLATLTNLRAALKHIGRRMNPDEDILVLYLTSHGDQNFHLISSYWPLRLDPLDPAALRAALDAAGIKWRVIAVSACYAGGYIEPLRSPTTLVMTAADATHTSFGCGTASDFTYFAKAVFDEQLRATYSFEQAFVRALPIIRERERGMQQEFSNPQIAVGAAMRAKLMAVERRLQAQAR
jgi:hypothetical protein